MDQEKTLKDILATYNSIAKSRTRWVRNRNNLRNEWKELFEALEKASGRDGRKAEVFDPNWQKLADKGGVRGVVDIPVDEVSVFAPAKAEKPAADPKQTDLEEAVEAKKAEAKTEVKKAPAKKTAKK